MKSAVRIVFVYIVIALLWIILSDSALTWLVRDYESLSWYSTVKGSFYVLATGGILYAMIRREMLQKSRMIVQLERAVRVRDDLIRELHHRVKNNMQNVISIIHLETGRTGFTEDSKQRILNKLYSISSVHDIIYNFEDFERISFSAVLKNFLAYVYVSFREEDLDVAEGVEYSIEEMVSLVLCLNELFEEFRTAGDVAGFRLRTRDRSRIDLWVNFSAEAACAFDLSTAALFLHGSGGSLSCEESEQALHFAVSFPV